MKAGRWKEESVKNQPATHDIFRDSDLERNETDALYSMLRYCTRRSDTEEQLQLYPFMSPKKTECLGLKLDIKIDLCGRRRAQGTRGCHDMCEYLIRNTSNTRGGRIALDRSDTMS